MLSIVPLLLLSTPLVQVGDPPVPAGWLASSNQTLLEASGPSQAVKIPVAIWDHESTPVAPDVSFSYAVTGSDKDTFIRITNASTTPPTTETQLFPQGVNLYPLEIQYSVSGGTSGYSAGVHTWTFAGHGITIPPKPKTGEPEPKIIEAKTYINRHRAEDAMPEGSVLHDAPYIVNVTLTRAAYTIWMGKELPIGDPPPGGQ